MGKQKGKRLAQVTKLLNVGTTTIVEFLNKKGFEIEAKPNTKIDTEQYELLTKEFAASIATKQEADGLTIGVRENLGEKKGVLEEVEETITIKSQLETPIIQKKTTASVIPPKEKKDIEKEEVVAKEQIKKTPLPSSENASKEKEDDLSKPVLKGLKVKGKVELDSKNRPLKKKTTETKVKKDTEKESSPKAAPKTKKVTETKTVEKPITKKEEVEEKKEVVVAKTKQEIPQKKVATSPTKEAVAKKEEVKTIKKKAEALKKETVKKEEKKENPLKHEAKKEVAAEKVPSPEKNTPKAKETEKTPVKTPIAQEITITPEQKIDTTIEAKADKLQGLKVLGKIELPTEKKKVASSDAKKRHKRKRIRKPVNKSGANTPSDTAKKDTKATGNNPANKKRRGGLNKKPKKEEVSQKDVHAEYKKTLARLSENTNKKTLNKRKFRKDKRASIAAKKEKLEGEIDTSILKITEFISTNELATLMNVGVNEIIAKCFGMGMIISINQRLDAEAIQFITDEFGFAAEFTSNDEEIEMIEEEVDKLDDLQDRAPIVTIMGHVDHGKTSLLDYIRRTKVAEGEAGGITQHIGAYDVTTESGKRIAFLDTPGHEAFTAMRARGAKLTDLAIIVIAADDSVMPQTEEALNHAQVAGVPIVIAINKIDKPGANPDKIKEELSQKNILVEEWGGKYQCYEISAKKGTGIDDLLEGVILETEVLELKANPNKKAVGTVVEAALDKGRGYVTTVLVQSGTMRIGDVILAGHYFGKVKAMTNHLGKKVSEAPPATPVQILGLSGAPQSGDRFNIMEVEKDAREVATKREQILREQKIRTTKRTTLGELGRRIALGNFKQLNIILKGDVDGSVEALAGSLLKLSTEEVEVKILHKGVGAITEADVHLATSSDAIIIGFQVRPILAAKKLAEKEEIEVRLYSVIYDAINEVKEAMEGLLSPEEEEVIVGNAEVRDVFRITKVGTVAGCYVTDGYIKRNAKVRLIRDGIVTFGGEAGGEINALKRFKDDVSEVRQSFECGLSLKNFNDIQEGDIIEAFEIRETKRSL